MYELVQVAENTYYINAPSKIGVYRVSDDDVWLNCNSTFVGVA